MNPHGRGYEHTLNNGLADVTPEEVYSTTAGFSGNAKSDTCDLVIVLDPYLATAHDDAMWVLEAKKRQGEGGKRVSSVFAGSKNEQTGIEELLEFIEDAPDWTSPIVALKFDRRKLAVLDARWIASFMDEYEYPIPSSVEDQLEILSPRVTRSGNVSMVKPSLDEWSSATAADDDAVVLARSLSLPLQEER